MIYKHIRSFVCVCVCVYMFVFVLESVNDAFYVCLFPYTTGNRRYDGKCLEWNAGIAIKRNQRDMKEIKKISAIYVN